jgi:hypothetical protein
MKPTPEAVLNADPELDQSRPLTPNPEENQYVENLELLNHLRSLMGKPPFPDANPTSELKDTGPSYTNAPKIMVSEMANPNCLDVPEIAYKDPDPNTMEDETNADPMSNVYQHDPELLNYLQTQISIPFRPASKPKDATNV